MNAKTKNVQGKDAMQRMNYLYQASRFASQLSIESKDSALQKCSDFISSYYTDLMLKIAKKNVIRIDTEIKRNTCKGCCSLLIAGKNAKVRLRRKPFKHVRWTCMKCFTVRKFKTKNDYKVWSEKPEAIVEVLEYDNKKQKKLSEETKI